MESHFKNVFIQNHATGMSLLMLNDGDLSAHEWNYSFVKESDIEPGYGFHDISWNRTWVMRLVEPEVYKFRNAAFSRFLKVS